MKARTLAALSASLLLASATASAQTKPLPAPPAPPAAPAPPTAPAPAPASPASTSAGAARPAPLSEALTGDAKIEYESAKLLYTNGDFASALIKFSAAHERSKDPRLLWNMAACEKSLRHYARALGLVRTYVADTTGAVSDEDRRDATELIKLLEQLTTKLRVNVSETGAEVLVDEAVVGTSPVEPLVIDLGTRKVRARKAGFADAAKEVTTTGGPELVVDLAMTKALHEGRVVVHAGPRDAIAIDGRVVGTGSFSANVPSGGHTLRVSAPNMRPYQSEILVSDGQPREISVTLEPESKGVPTWLWIAGGAVVASGLAVGGYFLFRQDATYEGPEGNLSPGIVQASAPIRFR